MPQGLAICGAKRHDSRMMVPTLDAERAVRAVGRTNATPTRAMITAAAAASAAPAASSRIAKPGIESSERLGRHRWRIERMLAWLARFLHLAVRQDRRASAHLAFNMPAVCENRDILPPTAGLWDFHPLGAAALPVEPWHRHYNTVRPHSALG